MLLRLSPPDHVGDGDGDWDRDGDTGRAGLVELRARRRDARRLQRTLAEIAGRGACRHPDGAVRMVASALHTFAVDVRAHPHGSGCRHGGDGDFFPVPEAH